MLYLFEFENIHELAKPSAGKIEEALEMRSWEILHFSVKVQKINFRKLNNYRRKVSQSYDHWHKLGVSLCQGLWLI
jgi:hypothetical protein